MMGGNNPVSLLKPVNPITDLDHLAAYFVAKHQWHLINPVPFHGIAAAYRTGEDFHQQFTRPNLWNRKFFKPNIPVIIIHCHAHKTLSPALRDAKMDISLTAATL
jgi:hypothetical protein